MFITIKYTNDNEPKTIYVNMEFLGNTLTDLDGMVRSGQVEKYDLEA